MRNRIPAVAVALSAVPLAACGSAPAAQSPAAASAAATHAAGPQGYQIPGNLEASLRRQMDRKARRGGYVFRVRSVTCVEQGLQKATCLAVFTRGGGSVNVSVAISADGLTYVSH